MYRYFLPLAFVFLLARYVEAGPIYVIKEKDGVIKFTSRPPPAGVKAEVFTGKGNYSVVRGSWRGSSKLFKNHYQDTIRAASVAHGLATSLIKAVIHAESGFNPRAVSRKGARGLMQLVPETSKEVGVANPLDPHQNIHGGSRYLAYLLRKYAGNEKLALAAYNAGPGAVDEYNGIPPYSETQNYVRRVQELKKRYERGS